MTLWKEWCDCVWSMRGACSRSAAFFWMALVLLGMSIRSDLAGVTSFVRCAFLDQAYYRALLHFFHSSAIRLDALVSLWVGLALRWFDPLTVNGLTVCVVDGLKAPKEGRKMPGVKKLHQESGNNSKPPYIMGHSFGCIALLVKTLTNQAVAVPLISRIIEGLILPGQLYRSLLSKTADLFLETARIANRPMLLLGDAYYAGRNLVLPLINSGHHALVRVKKNTVAFFEAPAEPVRKRGRPKKYGRKLKLLDLFEDASAFLSMPSPVYGEKQIRILVRHVDMIWRPIGKMVRFVLVDHPARGRIILLCTATFIDPIAIVALYGLRFKIEVSFKQAIHTIGAYAYHFWMKAMSPISRKSGDQDLADHTEKYRKNVMRKMAAYHRCVQLACIAQGILQHLAVNFKTSVWTHFKSWLCTMNIENVPSEQVVACALRFSFPDFLLDSSNNEELKKFILDHAALDRMPDWIMAA